jgi:hypothetical protein
MAASEWTCGVGAVRDNPVVNYSLARVITWCHIAYGPLMTISLFLVALSIYYVTRTL